jgi:hypothetical protein
MLKPIQLKAIELLADGRSNAQTAKDCDICSDSIRIWGRDKEFSRELKKEIRKRHEERSQFLRNAYESAINTILEIMLDDGNKPLVRLQAAIKIIDYNNNLSMQDFEERINELEDKLNEN